MALLAGAAQPVKDSRIKAALQAVVPLCCLSDRLIELVLLPLRRFPQCGDLPGESLGLGVGLLRSLRRFGELPAEPVALGSDSAER